MTSDKSGFTIVELIVTIIISGIFIYSAGLAMRQLIVLNERAEDLAIANATAQNFVEQMRSAGFLTLTDGTTDITDKLPNELLPPRSASYTTTTESAGLKQIKFDINFTINGELQQQEYTTFIGEVGVGQY